MYQPNEPLRLGDAGERVRGLQMALLRLGFSLPKWGADGKLGLETWQAMADFADEHDYEFGEAELGAEIPHALTECLHDLASRVPRLPVPPTLLDLTDRHSGKHRKGRRPWSRIDGIVLHQTAVALADRPERWHNVRAHVGITRDGKILHINPLTTVIYHGHRFNRHTIGIEISGNFEGVEGNRRTWWKRGGGPHEPSPPQLEAARQAISWLVDHAARHGTQIRHVFAHRQSSKMRAADPGSRIWQEVGLWSQRELGLDDGGPDFVKGGYPIPKEWDPRSSHPYRMW